MLLLLTILLSILAITAYKLANKELCAPSVLFSVPFVIMCIVALLFSEKWSFELHFTTFVIVFLGCFAFCVGTLFGGKIKLKGCGEICKITNEKEIKAWKLYFMLGLQLLCFFIKLKYLIAFCVSRGVVGDLSQFIVYYNNLRKFTLEDLSGVYPYALNLTVDFCTMFGFICACILAQQILLAHKDRQHILLLMCNFLVAIGGGLTSGGRGGAIQLIIAFLVTYLILYQRQYNWKKPFTAKTFFLCGLTICVAAYFFLLSLNWVGRREVHLVWQYLANYIGAQIFNLDYLVEEGINFSEIFGQETFSSLIEKFAKIFEINDWANYAVGHESIYAAGYSTGNVFSCFYDYYKDFGLLGVAVLPFIFGVIAQVIYRYARKSPSECCIHLALAVYSVLAYSISFSYFGNKFGELFFTTTMVKRTILLYLLLLFLYRIKIKCGGITFKHKRFVFKLRKDYANFYSKVSVQSTQDK